jgi:hypothetical protein
MIATAKFSGSLSIVEAAAERLAIQLTTTSYVIPAFEGFSSFTGGPTDVYCIESRLGESAKCEGYSTYIVAQSFSSKYPSLVVTFVVDLRDSDRQPSDKLAKIDRRIDRKLSTIFLPAMFTLLNQLDPSGKERGLVVQSYHSEMALGDLIHGSLYTLQLLARFKRDGQLAIIAVDFADPILLAMSAAIRGATKILGGDIHLISRQSTLSEIKLPIKKPGDGYYLVGGNSVALDAGLEKASSYFNKHFAS